MAYGCLSFFFSEPFLLDLCDLPLELVRVWPFIYFLLIYLSARVDLLEQWLCLIELIPPIELSPFPFLSLFSVVGHRLLVTSYLDSGADPLYSSVLEHMLRIVPAVLYFPPTLGLLYLKPQSNK